MINEKKRITYPKLFWLFMFGSVLGVLLEGFFCLFHYGHWETHVVSVWGPFCIIYGFGAAGLYIGAVLMEKKNSITQFIVFSLIATGIEYICGAVLKYGLGMKAWDYGGKFLSIDGLICFQMTIIWGLLGVLFSKYAIHYLDKIFNKMEHKKWKVICSCLSVFMAINLSLTVVAITRWSARHYGAEPVNRIEIMSDKIYNDEVMEKRFVEWRFIDDDMGK